jgi:hypothetical protein
MGHIDSFGGMLLPNRPTPLLPVLNGSNVLSPELLVEFMYPFDELRWRLGRSLGLWFHFLLRAAAAPSLQASVQFWSQY